MISFLLQGQDRKPGNPSDKNPHSVLGILRIAREIKYRLKFRQDAQGRPLYFKLQFMALITGSKKGAPERTLCVIL